MRDRRVTASVTASVIGEPSQARGCDWRRVCRIAAMTTFRASWVLYALGFALAARAYLPDLRLGAVGARIGGGVSQVWRWCWSRAQTLSSKANLKARRVWAKLRRKPPPVTITAASLLAAAATTNGTGTVTNPTGDAAIRGLQEGLARLNERQTTFERDTEEKRAQERYEEQRTRTKSAWYGILGLVLIGFATILLALSQTGH